MHCLLHLKAIQSELGLPNTMVLKSDSFLAVKVKIIFLIAYKGYD